MKTDWQYAYNLLLDRLTRDEWPAVITAEPLTDSQLQAIKAISASCIDDATEEDTQ
jgi:hypothetical protein